VIAVKQYNTYCIPDFVNTKLIATNGNYQLCYGVSQIKTAPLFIFYRAMHISAKRGIAIACRLSVCL